MTKIINQYKYRHGKGHVMQGLRYFTVSKFIYPIYLNKDQKEKKEKETFVYLKIQRHRNSM